jgi:hypothetical protein
VNQSIPDTTFTALTFDNETLDTAETFDTAGLHNPSVNNSRVTAPISGVYQVSAGVEWASNATGTRSLALFLNGVNTGFGLSVGSSTMPAPSAGPAIQNVSDLVKLSVGEFVEAGVAQTSGGNLNARFHRNTFLAMHWVGPR